jgi:hypothetical protein
MPSLPADPNRLVDQVEMTAAYEAARDVANQLIGLLWRHQQAASDPAEADALRAERLAVRTRQQALLCPGGEDVGAALREWGARVLALREQ